MAYYLQMDGVDDFLRAPQLTVDKLVIEFEYENNPSSTLAWYIYDNRSGTPSGNYNLFVNNTGVSLTKGSNTTALSVNGESGSASYSVTAGTRYVAELTHTAVTSAADGIEFFVSYALQPTSYTKGRIYDIKLYNGGVLQAHYDMRLGNVQDQSGNGKHGILTGGTWVEEGGGSTPITINAVPADATTDAIAPAVAAQQQITVSSVIADAIADAIAPQVGSSTNVTVNAVVVDVAASANVPSVDVVRNIGVGAVVANATAEAIAPFVGSAVSAQIAAVIAESTSDGLAPSVSIGQSNTVQAVIAEVIADGITPGIQTDAVISAVTAELQAIANAPSLNAKVIVGVIELNGKRELYVYLSGKRELNVSLKGGL